MAYSKDLRERVVSYVKSGCSIGCRDLQYQCKCSKTLVAFAKVGSLLASMEAVE
ncbi:MAG: hypothetical protein ACJA2R_000576 [Saprospiraceae bacterium]|jgi:hypothetical protein